MWTREQRTQYQRDWAARNKEKVRETKRKCRIKYSVVNAAKRREQRKVNREKLDAAKAKWIAANPEIVAAQRARARIRRMTLALERHLQFHYQLTATAYSEVLQLQNFVCAICLQARSHKSQQRLGVDHNHADGSLRGLLCSRCNSAIGYFAEDPALLRRAANYLERFNDTELSSSWPDRVRGVLASIP